MRLSSYHSIIIFVILFLKFCHLTPAMESFPLQPVCHKNEQSALLQFKQSMQLNTTACSNPMFLSWSPAIEGDCCLWEGVTCDQKTNHVISLDLGNSCLYGTFNSTNAIFGLIHLQQLNLAGNDFQHSQILSTFGNLSVLRSLNLSHSSFAGNIPMDILRLPQLESLDLSGNHLRLKAGGLETLAQNKSNLRELHLTEVKISSSIPDIFANLSSLTFLHLQNCELQGEFPTGIFFIPNIQNINLSFNEDLHGCLPEFHSSSPLKSLVLASTYFRGKLPNSIGNLNALDTFDLGSCHFSGLIPWGISNLTNLSYLQLLYNKFQGQIPLSFGNLTQLTHLSLAYNNFTPTENPPWLRKLTKLKHLYLSGTNLYGDLPSSLATLTYLERLHLDFNQLTGQIPSWLGDLSHLIRIGLAGNELEGSIPSSIFKLQNLTHLRLSSNNLNGVLNIDSLRELTNLAELWLSFNRISVITSARIDFSLPKLKLLALDSCNINEFPHFLKNQDGLLKLTLSHNNIDGNVPSWFLNISRETLLFLNISYNFLTGFDQRSTVLPWAQLKVFDLSFNMLQGLLPVPSPTTQFFSISNNNLTEEISLSFCNAVNLQVLDLSNNHLTGVIHECLGRFSNSLKIFNLRSNMIHGNIPEMFTSTCNLKGVDFSRNKFEGQMPRSLANCTALEWLNFGANQIHDTFPSWLGNLPELQVPILRSNRFYGGVGAAGSKSDFPKLRIIDISYNLFTGNLPSDYFQNWKAMHVADPHQLTYMREMFYWIETHAGANVSLRFSYPMTMIMENKGTEIMYPQISNLMTAIILSSNKFEGEIPESIGNLKGLHVLNLSNNNLVGVIPSALGNLRQLESLDLSFNMLSGSIPQWLVQLTFLEKINLSYNHLSGQIPHGGQFETFDNSSFFGNEGLCGVPLSKTCEGVLLQPTIDVQDDDETSIEWTKVLEGFGAGVVIGLAIGYILTTLKHEWFMRTFHTRLQKWKGRKPENA